jgi:folate-binding Fe-S cluster repair protein YgfZ
MARLHFKGGNKRWLHHISFACERLPDPGTRFGAGSAEAGILVDVVQVRPHRAEALAVLSDSAAASRLGDGAAGALSDIQVISRFS